jgi:hypothetical protein
MPMWKILAWGVFWGVLATVLTPGDAGLLLHKILGLL